MPIQKIKNSKKTVKTLDRYATNMREMVRKSSKKPIIVNYVAP